MFPRPLLSSIRYNTKPSKENEPKTLLHVYSLLRLFPSNLLSNKYSEEPNTTGHLTLDSEMNNAPSYLSVLLSVPASTFCIIQF